VQGGALHLGDRAGALGEEGGQELEGDVLAALNLDGADGLGGESLDVRLDADAARLAVGGDVGDGDGEEGVGVGSRRW
jgi:hypothetical protein